MDASTIIWILVAVVVVGAIVAFVVSRSGARRVGAERAKAAEIREKALGHDRRLREDEASAAEADARAQMARAEAQKRELEAERLAAEASRRSESAETVRRERDEQLRLADLRDPDVETDTDGNRLDQRTAGVGAQGGSMDGRPDSRREGRSTEGVRDGQVGDGQVGDGQVGDGRLSDGRGEHTTVQRDSDRDGDPDYARRRGTFADASGDAAEERTQTYGQRRTDAS